MYNFKLYAYVILENHIHIVAQSDDIGSHYNPVKRGYIDEAEHWRYSSARDYKRVNGLLEVECFW